MKNSVTQSLFLMVMFCGAAFAQSATYSPTGQRGPGVPPQVWVRAGYRLTLAAEGIEKARFMQRSPEGWLYVSVPGEGRIHSLRDADSDGRYERVADYVTGRDSVHGMQFHEGRLWYTQSQAIYSSADTNNDGVADEEVKVLDDKTLPGGSGHWWRPVLIHGGRLYTSVGDSGNITDEPQSRRQTIFSYALDGSDEQLYATGLRNTEKLVVRPGTDEIWGMDHGSDWFGKQLEDKEQQGQPITNMNPPCEMNRYDKGGFYGHPFIVGNRLPRYEYMNRKDIVELAARSTPPMWSAGAHWAPNAMCFYDGAQFPSTRGDAFVAYHGSWNRTDPGGYCVTRVFFEAGKPWGEQVYVDFHPGTEGPVLGRPVDVITEPDGALLISDDFGNRIYRLSAIAQ